MLKTLGLLPILLLGFLLTGCGGTAIYNVKNEALPNTTKYTTDNVRDAIIRAGAGRNWSMEDVGNNTLIATLEVRSHMAKVKITYTDKTFDITYQDSNNLEYSGDTIHKKYNSWVLNLKQDIKKELQRR